MIFPAWNSHETCMVCHPSFEIIKRNCGLKNSSILSEKKLWVDLGPFCGTNCSGGFRISGWRGVSVPQRNHFLKKVHAKIEFRPHGRGPPPSSANELYPVLDFRWPSWHVLKLGLISQLHTCLFAGGNP